MLLVEQHYMVGGYCSTFRRGGYTFDAATHFYPLLGNPETLTGRLLAELGVATGWVKMDPVDTFHFPDGTRFAVPADFDAYLARLKAEFPAEAAALDGFFAAVREAYLLGLLALLPRPARGRARSAVYRDLTVHDALDRWFRDPQAQAPAHRRLPALGVAAGAHLVRLRLDAAPLLLPRQLLPAGGLAGLRRRAGPLLRGAGRPHPDQHAGAAHRRRGRRGARRRGRGPARPVRRPWRGGVVRAAS